MSVEILKMSREHLSDVANIEKACFSAPWSEKALELLLAENNFAIVAVADGKAVAYAGFCGVLDEGEITNVATLPEYRRQHIAIELMKCLLGTANANGIKRITLEVRVSNISAQSLYRQCGFTECGLRKNFYQMPREDAIIFEYKFKD